jgi:ribonuclease P protein component
VWLRSFDDGSAGQPRVAYAVGRHVGPAVVRNRARRRLRAAVSGYADELRPGTAYLFGAEAAVVSIDFETLSRHVGELIASAREEDRP